MGEILKSGAWILLAAALSSLGCGSDPSSGNAADTGGTGTSNSVGGTGNGSGGNGTNANSTGGTGTSNSVGGTGNGSGGNGTNANSTGGTGQIGGTSSGGILRKGEFTLHSLVSDSLRVNEVWASFYTLSQACPSQQFGDCVVLKDCSTSPTYFSAGVLTVTTQASASLKANNISITPDADNTYTGEVLSGMFGGQEVAHLTASGGTVPAFSVDVTAPLVLLIDSPTPSATGNIQASASSDLVIQFSRGATGVVLFAQIYARGSAQTLECTSPVGASSLTIPKAALGSFVGGSIGLYTRAVQDRVVGDFTVTTGIYMNAYTTNKQSPVVIDVQ
jgi:hypothetical protein